MASTLSILLLGEPGIGKSTLVNGLVGKRVAKVSAKGKIEMHGVTKELECYNAVSGEVNIEVWDTRGLLDPELVLKDKK